MLGYELVMGRTLIFWTGIISFLFLILALLAVLANKYAGMRLIVSVHRNLAIAGLAFVLMHLALVLSG